MKDNEIIKGFSKWTPSQKQEWLNRQLDLSATQSLQFEKFKIQDGKDQQVIDELSENVIANYHLPFSIAPNVLVNGKMKVFPLVSEESSVVAALAKACSFWAKRGGFHTELLGTEKKGQVHFQWKGNPDELVSAFSEIKSQMLKETESLWNKMKKRGGGIGTMQLNYLPEILDDYFQLDVSFETCDAMGANFINSCLEQFGKVLIKYCASRSDWPDQSRYCEIIMAILSNYVPNSRVLAKVNCPVEDLVDNSDREAGELLAKKIIRAVAIAQKDVSRAVTHNKGIFNGVDALAVATGNDFRAIEAGAHAYASRNGNYGGLTSAFLERGQFIFLIELPLAVGVVGGVTALHPMARQAMAILEHPSASELMQYMAVAGLASNWSAVRALVTTGIQKGHMKMHLSNLLNTLKATDEQKKEARLYFKDKEVSFAEVEQFLNRYAKN